jgi:hypothetical protein
LHSCHSSLSVNTQPKSGLTLKASCAVSLVNTSGPVRLPLQPSPESLYVCAFALRLFASDRRRLCGSQVLRLSLSPHAAVLTPGSRPVLVPTASRSAMAFAQNVEARRVGRMCDFIPVTRLSQQYLSGSNSRSCNVRLMLRPAVSVGATDWVPPCLRTAVQGYRVGACSASLLPERRDPNLFSQVGYC